MTRALMLLSTIALMPSLGAAVGGLKFTHTTGVVRVTPGSNRAEFVFPYINEGQQTVTITELHASCGCTTPTVSRKVVAPGEDGTLWASLSLGSDEGTIVKSISVTTDEPDSQPYRLTIRAEVPELVKAAPKQLFWAADEEPESRTITLTYASDAKVRLVSAVDPKALYSLSWTENTDRPGQISVAPRSKGPRTSSRAVLTFETDDHRKIEKTVFLHTLRAELPPIQSGQASPQNSTP